MTVFRGRAVSSTSDLSVLEWIAALSWLSLIAYTVRGIARLLGWRHTVSLELSEDGAVFFVERTSVLDRVISEKKQSLGDDVRLTHVRWTQGDPRLLIMGASFLAISWAVGVHHLMEGLRGADGSLVISGLFWFTVGLVVDVIMWILASRIQQRVVTVRAGSVEFTAVPEVDELE